MRSLVVAAVALLLGCGEVNKVVDAGPPDAYVPDTLTCGAGEMVCSGGCANVMTSEQYCGNCTTSCTAVQGCASGTCVDLNTDCNRVREIDPMAPDDVYSNPQTGDTFYCDFTARKQYSFGLGLYTVGYAGYVLLRASDLTNPSSQKAFIATYNYFNGMKTLGTSTITLNNYCCITTLSSGTAVDITVAGSQVFPEALPCSTLGVGSSYRMYVASTGLVLPPMPADYFATHTPSEGSFCSHNTNPGLFIKTTTF